MVAAQELRLALLHQRNQADDVTRASTERPRRDLSVTALYVDTGPHPLAPLSVVTQTKPTDSLVKASNLTIRNIEAVPHIPRERSATTVTQPGSATRP